MKKIVVMNVCAKHPPYDGRVYKKISMALLGCGYEVHNSSPNIETALTDDGIYLHGFVQKKGYINRIFSLRNLQRVIKEVSPDCMICHEPDALYAAYKYYKKEKKRRKIKLLFDCHEAYEYWFQNLTKYDFINNLAGRFIVWNINRIVKNIDGVTSVNKTMTKRYKAYNKNSYFLPSVYKNDCENNYIENNKTDFVYMGQYGNSKQIEMFIGAAKILNSMGVPFQITIIGGDKDKDKDPLKIKAREEKLEDYFVFKGWMQREEAFEELKRHGVGILRFDSYTMPGNYAMPNKLFEYMSLGLCIISCQLNLEVKSIVEQYNCGVLIEDESAGSLAKAIQYLCEHPKEVKTMKHNSYLATVYEFNWDNYKNILKKMVEDEPQ